MKWRLSSLNLINSNAEMEWKKIKYTGRFGAICASGHRNRSWKNWTTANHITKITKWSAAIMKTIERIALIGWHVFLCKCNLMHLLCSMLSVSKMRWPLHISPLLCEKCVKWIKIMQNLILPNEIPLKFYSTWMPYVGIEKSSFSKTNLISKSIPRFFIKCLIFDK